MLLASWLCEAAELGGDVRETAYWVTLLRYVGCTGHAHSKCTATSASGSSRRCPNFDAVAFARPGAAPALFSVGLMDLICPPSTVYAAYNAYAGEKRIAIYPHNDHEGGGAFHQVQQMTWLRSLL